jgi:alkylhydroperoxidase family enzyme
MENGLTEAKIAQLDTPENSYTPRENIAIEYAEKLATDHASIDDAFFERLHSEFGDAEILELGMMIGQYIGFGRLLKALDLVPQS